MSEAEQLRDRVEELQALLGVTSHAIGNGGPLKLSKRLEAAGRQ